MAVDLSQPPDQPYGFFGRDVERIKQTVRYVENVQRTRPRPRARYPLGSGGTTIAIYPAKAGGSGIPARATAGNGFQQVGSASVTILKRDASGYLYVELVSIVLTAGGSGYTNGLAYALGIASGDVMSGHDATGTFDVVAGAVTNLKIVTGGEYKPGGTTPTITFPGAGAGSGATTGTKTLGQAVTCNSDFGTAVGANHHLMVGLDGNGDYWVMSEDC